MSNNLSYFDCNGFGFYSQNAIVQNWVDNTTVFMEVASVSNFLKELHALDLTTKYKMVKLVPIRPLDWGKECFVPDPSGILWHLANLIVTKFFFNKLTTTN